MTIPNKIKDYLDKKHIIYDVRELSSFASLLQAAGQSGISPASLVRATILKDEIGCFMVVVQANCSLDITQLSQRLRRRIYMATEQEILKACRDCNSRFIPPLGEAFGLRTMLDEAILGLERMYFAAGDDKHLIEVTGKDFAHSLSNTAIVGNFSQVTGLDYPEQAGVTGEKHKVSTAVSDTSIDIRQQISRLTELPAMPEMARKIYELRSNPHANAEKLSQVIEMDPSLAAQVIRYARSPFFAYSGKIDSVNTAISRVLGFEMVMNLAMGVASAKPFKIPAIGPLGLNSFWRHATYSAALVQALGRELPHEIRPPAGLSYLSGLLHNFGHLLLGHLFKREYCTLSNLIMENPETPIIQIERDALGIEHGELGAWLMDAWRLPEEVIVAAREHHNPDYHGEYEIYPRLVLVADRMLKSHGIGDAESSEVPGELLHSLGLDELQTIMVMNRILEGIEGLNTMARQLAA